MQHYVGLGVKGFRCDAAYQVPAPVWRDLIDAAHDIDGEVEFYAETLGCTVEQVDALGDAGFDYLFNSAKWWDFQEPWLLDQYNQFRHIAPSVAFPESHDTERLAADVGSQDRERLAAILKMRYLFSACFSAGVMMPIGYEYGFTRKMDVVTTTPEDWEEPKVDISQFVADVNSMRAATPAFNVEGPQFRITAPHSPVVGLCRQGTGDVQDCAIVLINPDENRAHSIDPGPLLGATGGLFDGFRDVTPQCSPQLFRPGEPIVLAPLELRVFRGNPEAQAKASRGVDSAERQQELRQLLETLAKDRIAIEGVYPELDGGRFAIKREVGDVLEVWADVFTDGHEKINACLRYRVQGDDKWREEPLAFFDNDRWLGNIPLTQNGRYFYTIIAWRDLFETWRSDFIKKQDAGQKLSLELIEGRELVERSAKQAAGADREVMEATLERLSRDNADEDLATRLLLSNDLHIAMRRSGERTNLSHYKTVLECFVDRTAARYAAWYEVFPRSMSDDVNRHGNFDDVIRKLPYVRDMGFDVLYFTPIHPIGKSFRKGKNNTLDAQEDDAGSPYAIGSPEGGHDAIAFPARHLRRFRPAGECGPRPRAGDRARLRDPVLPGPSLDQGASGMVRLAARRHDQICRESAQEVPGHRQRPLLSRRPARHLVQAARHRAVLGASKGVRIFRVDNPHTKPLPFWEWMIREVQDRYPDALFLAEAFTRPKMMKRLAKVGFTQSYSYFTWRNFKQELTDYLVELTMLEPKEYMRANFFANTPDINPPILQSGQPGVFKMRAVLAATLSSVYGLYSGYELCEGKPIPGREEYLNSEKYEIKAWDWDRPGNIRNYITRLNKIRRENPALHEYDNLRFYGAYDDNILYYGKMTKAKDNFILIAVNLDPNGAHGGTIEVPLWELGLPDSAHVEVEDLLTGGRFFWYGKFQQVHLDPQMNPCAIWRVIPPGIGQRT